MGLKQSYAPSNQYTRKIDARASVRSVRTSRVTNPLFGSPPTPCTIWTSEKLNSSFLDGTCCYTSRNWKFGCPRLTDAGWWGNRWWKTLGLRRCWGGVRWCGVLWVWAYLCPGPWVLAVTAAPLAARARRLALEALHLRLGLRLQLRRRLRLRLRMSRAVSPSLAAAALSIGAVQQSELASAIASLAPRQLEAPLQQAATLLTHTPTHTHYTVSSPSHDITSHDITSHDITSHRMTTPNDNTAIATYSKLANGSPQREISPVYVRARRLDLVSVNNLAMDCIVCMCYTCGYVVEACQLRVYGAEHRRLIFNVILSIRRGDENLIQFQKLIPALYEFSEWITLLFFYALFCFELFFFLFFFVWHKTYNMYIREMKISNRKIAFQSNTKKSYQILEKKALSLNLRQQIKILTFSNKYICIHLYIFYFIFTTGS